MTARLDPEPRRALEETADLLRSLGHEVRERDPDYGLILVNATPRYLRGIHEDARALAHPARLERRSRAMARIGSLVPAGIVERARAAEPRQAARIDALFAECDVLLTPVTARPAPEIGRWEGRGPLWTLMGAARLVPYCPPWNATGQPAAAIPAGTGENGLPRAVQLVGRRNDEPTLFSLAAQMEAERPWADARPQVART